MWVALSATDEETVAQQPDRGRVTVERKPRRAASLHERRFGGTTDAYCAKAIRLYVCDSTKHAAKQTETWGLTQRCILSYMCAERQIPNGRGGARLAKYSDSIGVAVAAPPLAVDRIFGTLEI